MLLALNYLPEESAPEPSRLRRWRATNHGRQVIGTTLHLRGHVGIPKAAVYRIKEDPAKAVALLETWGIS